MKQRGWLIGISIVLGIVLSCAILPLGALAILSSVGSGSAETTVPGAGWREQVVSGSGVDRVVIIDVEGVIGQSAASVFSSQLTQEQLLSQIRYATQSERVKAVVLRVNSPGGGVVASNELHTELKELREAGKRLVVSMGDTAASGGYYIATAGERVYANPDTLTGSLGVIVSLLNYDQAFDRLGLEQYVFKSGEFKDIGSPTRNPTEPEQQIWQALVDEAYQGFVDVIVEGRGLSREEVLRIADGRIYTGRQALDLKLIDELGNLDEAVEGAKELAGLENALVVRYRASESLRDILLSSTTQRQQNDPLGLKAALEPQAPKLEYRLVP